MKGWIYNYESKTAEMGCVLGRESSLDVASGSNKEEKNPGGESRKKEVSAAKLASGSNSKLEEVQESEAQKEEKVEGDHKSRESRRRSRQNANPRPRNVPKQSRAEQGAAGWPSWLTEICGEALRGWVPRRADTFEKIDKVR